MHKNGLSSLRAERGLQAVLEFIQFDIEYGAICITDTLGNITVVYVQISSHSVTTKSSVCLSHAKHYVKYSESKCQ